MNLPPTLADVARRASVSPSTASRVLRGLAGVRPDKVRRVKEAAKALGFAPNPLMQVLLSGVRRRTPERRANLAIVSDFDASLFDRKGWNPRRMFRDAVQARAAELGFGLEFLHLGSADAVRIRKIFHTCSVAGAIFLPITSPIEIDFPWDHFPVSLIGRSFVKPAVHYVIPHYFHAMTTLLETVVARGYRRVAYLATTMMDNHMEHIPMTVFRSWQLDLKAKDRLPAALAEGWTTSDLDDWLSRNEPDAVIVGRSELGSAIAATGRRIPEDVAVATLSCRDTPSHFTGSRLSFDGMGVAAVDLTVAQCYRNERGIPRRLRCVLIETEWHEGTSLPDRNNTTKTPASRLRCHIRLA